MNQQQSGLPRILIVTAVLALVALVAWFVKIQGMLNDVALARANLDSLRSDYNTLSQTAQYKPKYIALIRQVQSRLTNVELTADPRAYIPSYLKQIEDLATRDGLVVTAVVPQPLPTPSGSPSPSAVATVAPFIAAPVSGVGHALNTANTQALHENAQMPQPSGAAMMAGATPVPVPSGGAAPTATVKAGATMSPHQVAEQYLTQSFQQVPINMELSGTYTNLQKFLRDLNKFPKLIGVGNVTLTSARANVGETPNLHIVLPIVAYRLGPNAPPGATPSPSTPNGGQTQ